MKIRMDSKTFDVKEQFYKSHDELPPTPTCSGAQLLALVGRRDLNYQVWREQRDSDQFIALTDAVELHDGDEFYAVPPINGG